MILPLVFAEVTIADIAGPVASLGAGGAAIYTMRTLIPLFIQAAREWREDENKRAEKIDAALREVTAQHLTLGGKMVEAIVENRAEVARLVDRVDQSRPRTP